MAPPSAEPATSRSALRRLRSSLVARAAIVVLGYLALARIGLLFAAEDGGFAAVRPAAGFLLGVLLVAERRSWPAYLGAAAAAGFAANLIEGSSAAASAGFALASCLESGSAAAVVRLATGRDFDLGDVRHVVVLIGGAVLASNAVTALAGAGVAALASGAELSEAWLLWWAADGMGMLAVTPVVIVLARPGSLARPHPRAVVEASLCLLGVTGMSFAVFAGAAGRTVPFLDFPYPSLPFLLWAALRFGPAVTAPAILVLISIGARETLAGRGPFGDAGQPAVANVLELQAFLLVAAVSGLAVAAAAAGRRRASAALAASEQHTRAIIETAHEAFVSIGRDGRVQAWNPEAERMLGYERADALSRPARELLAPWSADDTEWWERLLAVADEAELPDRIELGLRHRDGHCVPVELTASIVDHGEGRTLNVFVRDVSERKRSEEALREAEERFRRAFEDAGTGMALVGVEGASSGRLLEVNDALCSITRTPRDELLGVALADLTYPDDLAEYARGMRDLTDGRITRFECEQRMLDADGEIVWIGLTTSLVRDAHGRPLYRIAQLQDVSQRKRFEGQLQHLADHDPLTGLFNRRRFDEELARELSAARRYGSGGAVLALDLDNFKYVNDSLGHAAGDELITSVGQALRRRLRGSDTLGRLGGDEFALVLPHVDRATAESVAQDILEAVSRECRVATTKGARRVSVSIGVACFDTEPKRMTSEELLVEADIAMYDAKEAGRDCYRVFSPEAGRQERMEARLTWVERIRKALEEERFVLHAQPIVALNGTDGGPREELLLRMVDEDGDLVPPGVFLYIAESYDLVQEIDRWVVREAIRLLAREASAGRPVTFEVNLSAKSITDPELPTYVGRQLAAAGVDPQRLVFEVTETAAIVNIDRAKLFAKELGELGCGFALDDFGAGFASFYYLKHLVFDYIKIDGEFIEGLAGNRTDQLVVRSLVEIARGLGKQTIAEFVGDAETLELVRTHGVDFAQGFHLGKPGPVGARASLEGEVPSPPPALARRGGR